MTALGGGSRSGMCVRASGGAVAHSVAGCWSSNPASRRCSVLSTSWLPSISRRRPGQLLQLEQRAALAPGVGMRDVAHAEAGVFGLYLALPRLDRVPIYLGRCSRTGVPSFPAPCGSHRCRSDQVQIIPGGAVTMGMLRPRISAFRNGSPVFQLGFSRAS